MQNETKLSVEEIQFLNGHNARMVYTEDETLADEIINSLEIEKPGNVIFISGGAGNLGEENKPRLNQLFSRVIATTAIENKTLLVDGGTDSGVMSLTGMAVVDRGRKTNLLGVSPADMVDYPGKSVAEKKAGTFPLEPNHSHFVLVKKENFGSEKDTLFKILKHYAKDRQVLMILVNGGELSKFEVLNCVRMGIPIIVLEDSGRLADEIAKLRRKPPKFIEDPIMAEIIEEGNIHLVKTSTDVPRFKRLLQRLISGNSMVRQAWEQYEIYNFNAKRQQKLFNRIQKTILILAVLATTLAVVQVRAPSWLLALSSLESSSTVDDFLRFLIILIPITVSVFIAASNRFKYGQKWIFLRSAAEEIKQEIFKYRARSGIYSEKNTKKIWRDVKLSKKLTSIRSKVMQTDVNLAGIKIDVGKIESQLFNKKNTDNGLSPINPDQYVKFRLDDQLRYYKKTTISLEKQLKYFQWGIYVVGGLGTLLAAWGMEIWIAVTTALAGSFTTYMQFKQMEKTLMEYNQSAADLSNIRDWWIALPPLEQSDRVMIDKLVGMTENVFKRENAGWVQQMQDMIEELQEDQKTVDDKQTA